MTVFARGYRPYTGRLQVPGAWWAIAVEGYRTASRSVAFKRLRGLFFLFFCFGALLLYLQVGTELAEIQKARTGMRDVTVEDWSVRQLHLALQRFYFGVAFLTALVGILVGSSLISNDLGARALPLYLVRPIRAFDYVLGKALVVPLILLWVALLPGIAFYIMLSLWQPPGESWSFFVGHLDIVGGVVEHYLLAAATYTGLALLVSSRTSRRGVAAAAMTSILFGGIMLQTISAATRMRGTLADVLRHANLPWNTVNGITRDADQYRWRRHAELIPDASPSAVIAVALLLVGLWFAWRRARTVEVTS